MTKRTAIAVTGGVLLAVVVAGIWAQAVQPPEAFPASSLVAFVLFGLSIVISFANIPLIWANRRQIRFQITASGFRLIPASDPLLPAIGTLTLVAAAISMLIGGHGLLAPDTPPPVRLTLTVVSIACVLPFLALGVLIASTALRPGGTELTPEGIGVTTPFAHRFIPWEALASGGPPRPSLGWNGQQIRLAVVRPDLVQQRGFQASMGPTTAPTLPLQTKTHRWLIADAIRWYAEHPEDRAAIGTEAEHDRLTGRFEIRAEVKPSRPLTIAIAVWTTYAGVLLGVLTAVADLVLMRVFGDELLAADPELTPTDVDGSLAMFTIYGAAEVAAALLAGAIAVVLAKQVSRGADPARLGLAVLSGLVLFAALCPCGSPLLGLDDTLAGPFVFMAWFAIRGLIALAAIATLVLLVVPASERFTRPR